MNLKPIAYLTLLGMTYGCGSISIGDKEFKDYTFRGKKYNINMITTDGRAEMIIKPLTKPIKGYLSCQDSDFDGILDRFKFIGDTTGIGSLADASLKDFTELEKTLVASMKKSK